MKHSIRIKSDKMLLIKKIRGTRETTNPDAEIKLSEELEDILDEILTEYFAKK